jgi:hypothetical protein
MGWFQQVHAKSIRSQEIRALLVALAMGPSTRKTAIAPKSGASITPSTTRQLGDLGRPMGAEQL